MAGIFFPPAGDTRRLATSCGCKQDSPPQAAPFTPQQQQIHCGIKLGGKSIPFTCFWHSVPPPLAVRAASPLAHSAAVLETKLCLKSLSKTQVFQAVSADGLRSRNVWMSASSQKPSSPFLKTPGLRSGAPLLRTKSEVLLLNEKNKSCSDLLLLTNCFQPSQVREFAVILLQSPEFSISISGILQQNLLGKV